MALTQEDLKAIADLLEPIREEVQDMKEELGETNRRLTKLELHIENATDKNIQLLAEHFVELTKKVNQAIPIANNNLAYEVKVNYLLEEMDKLKADVAELKNKIA